MVARSSGSFFPVLLDFGVAFGVSGVGGDFAPSVAGEEFVDDRGGDGFFQVLGERGAEGRDDDHAARSGLLKPGLKEGFFFFRTHELATASAPVLRRCRGGCAELSAKSLLHAWNGGAAHAKDGCDLFQRGSDPRGKQNRLA